MFYISKNKFKLLKKTHSPLDKEKYEISKKNLGKRLENIP